MEVITATLVLDVNDISPSWHVNGLSVGPAHEPIIYLTEHPHIEGSLDEQPLTRLRILCQTPTGWRTFEIPDMLPWFRDVQPLPDGAWLIVGSFPSEQRRPSAFPSDNARVYGADGSLKQSFYAGRSITQMQSTIEGLVWYGYGDEGIFGDRLGSAGLACRDLEGNTLFGYSSYLHERIYPSLDRRKQRQYSMHNCSALNAAAPDEIWACYSGGEGNPIVRLNQQGIKEIWLDNPIHGRSMAVEGRRVLFGHVHGLDWRLLLVSLDSLEMVEILPVDNSDESILPIKQRRYPSEDVTFDVPAYELAARGSKLYILTDDGRLYHVDLRTIEVEFTEAQHDVSLEAIERRIEGVPSVLAMRGIVAVLVRHWAGDSRARDLLVRCFEISGEVNEDSYRLVRDILDALALHWTEDDDIRTLLTHLVTETDQSILQELALGAVTEHWPKDERMRDLLLDRATSDPDSGVRDQALSILVQHWPSHSAVFPLVRDELLMDPDPERRVEAVRLLRNGWRGLPHVRPLLHERTSDPDPKVRATAVDALGNNWLIDAVAGRLLMEFALSDPEPQVRQNALYPLARFEALLLFLKERAVEDDDADARLIVIRRLADKWNEHPGTLAFLRERAVFDNHPRNRWWALGLIAKHWQSDPETLPYLIECALNDPDREMAGHMLQIIERGWEVDMDRLHDLMGEIRDGSNATAKQEVQALLRAAAPRDPQYNRF